ncbi:MAG: hypothetical protein NTV34_14460 [Proteobacteria bacterium]|nr:hypothetical protein [Pseudomonadota bacterium]
MKRIQLFEFEDFRWFPGVLRECLTNYIVAFHRMLGTPKIIAPLVDRMLDLSQSNEILDLCSGGGGAMTAIVELLRHRRGRAVNVTLTDLFPNQEAALLINGKNIAGLRYLTTPVDASNIPSERSGVRTMISGFHHMPEPVARGILADAFHKRQPIFIFEITNNTPPTILWWVPLPFVALMALVHTPFMRPLTWRQIFFTYIVPVMPLLIAWDGTASNPRTYNSDDFKELTAPLSADDYRWEIQTMRPRFYPEVMLCVMGYPVNAGGLAS